MSRSQLLTPSTESSTSTDTRAEQPTPASSPETTYTVRIRPMLWQLLPGMVLPGLIFLVASRQGAPVLVALAAASSVPLLDAVVRLIGRRPPNAVAGVFVFCSLVSIGLALWSGSGMFILAKGAALSAVIGLAFAVSAAIGRPLTRTLALRLSAPKADDRRQLAERWSQPRVASVFRVLAAAWGILLLLQAVQQVTMALTLPAGTVITLEGPIHMFVTLLGVAGSIAYVRHRERHDPAVALLPSARF